MNVWIAFGLAPASISKEANVWRHSWSVIGTRPATFPKRPLYATAQAQLSQGAELIALRGEHRCLSCREKLEGRYEDRSTVRGWRRVWRDYCDECQIKDLNGRIASRHDAAIRVVFDAAADRLIPGSSRRRAKRIRKAA